MLRHRIPESTATTVMLRLVETFKISPILPLHHLRMQRLPRLPLHRPHLRPKVDGMTRIIRTRFTFRPKMSSLLLMIMPRKRTIEEFTVAKSLSIVMSNTLFGSLKIYLSYKLFIYICFSTLNENCFCPIDEYL